MNGAVVEEDVMSEGRGKPRSHQIGRSRLLRKQNKDVEIKPKVAISSSQIRIATYQAGSCSARETRRSADS